MITQLWRRWRAVRRFRSYQPQPVTFRSLNNWLVQFDKTDQGILLDLLDRVNYITQDQTREYLVKRNDVLLNKLQNDGIHKNKIIYVQFDQAGSSSSLMLNMLKEAAHLETSGCKFLDSRDVSKLHELTNELEEGAIVYVDDFIGTSNQFFTSRNFTAQHIVGNFPEFLLSVCICQEAMGELQKHGVQPIPGIIHAVADRPLNELGSVFEPELRQRLLALGSRTNKKGGLGYQKLASMVVFYRNAPNGLPRILRGDQNQTPFVGVLPRSQDLPRRK